MGTTRTTLTIDNDLIDEAARLAHRDHTSRAHVLTTWLRLGREAAEAVALADAYERFYAEPDEDAVSTSVRRKRAARFDGAWD